MSYAISAKKENHNRPCLSMLIAISLEYKAYIVKTVLETAVFKHW